MPDPLSSPVSPAEGRTRLTEQWRQAVYPHVEAETFARYLADETLEGWDDVRVEVAALHAIVAAALVLRPSEDWQPIDTAPKDGRFDVWAKAWLPAFDRFECRRFADCYWREADPMGAWRAGIVGLDKGWRATHWRPLPPAPGTEDR